MMNLSDKKIAIVVTDGFEQSELTGPRKALEKAGADTFIISPKADVVKAWKSKDWGETFEVDVPIAEADASEYDALLLPGGVMNPDKLRTDPNVIAFIRRFFEAGKPVAAICHGPWLLIDAGVVSGRRLTAWPSIRTDLTNAGAEVVDEQVVVDGGLITSRKPDDIPAFSAALIESIAERPDQRRRRARSQSAAV